MRGKDFGEKGWMVDYVNKGLLPCSISLGLLWGVIESISLSIYFFDGKLVFSFLSI